MSSEGNSSHVLLTGANGFVAMHILSILLERGFSVTATVRSMDKADGILKTHPRWRGKVNFYVVTDFTSSAPFDDIFKSSKRPFDYILHTASPVKFQVQDIQKEMLEPAEMGTTEILKSVHKFGGASVKRVVILGSAVSVLNSFEDISREGRPYSEKDWNPVTAEQAIEKHDTVLGYNVSKKRAEEAAWAFMKEIHPSFDLTVINPDIITGPMIHEIKDAHSINQTNHFAIASFIDGTHKEVEGVRFPFYHFVDVRDVARAHVDALTNSAAAGQRVLLISGLITPQLVVNIIRKNFPELRDRVPEGDPSKVLPDGVCPTGWDLRLSMNILSQGTRGKKWEYIDLDTSVIDSVKSMLEAKVI